MRHPKVTFFQRADGRFDWKLVSGNGREQCGSLQGYRSTFEATRGYYAALRAMNEAVL